MLATIQVAAERERIHRRKIAAVADRIDHVFDADGRTRDREWVPPVAAVQPELERHANRNCEDTAHDQHLAPRGRAAPVHQQPYGHEQERADEIRVVQIELAEWRHLSVSTRQPPPPDHPRQDVATITSDALWADFTESRRAVRGNHA